MNRTILKGRLTKDIELKYTQSADAKAYANFSVAVDRFKKGECDFISCMAWGGTAELLHKYFKKGQEILIEGRIQVDQSEKDGVKQTYFKVVAERVEFCGSKGGNDATNTNDESEDDLPF